MRKKPDQIAIVNKARWEEVVKEGAGCTRPYLELDVEAFRAYREGETRVLPKSCAALVFIISKFWKIC